MRGLSLAQGKWFRVVALLLVVAAALLGVAVWMSASTATGAADPADRRQVKLVEQIYRTNCAQCHGDQLQGQPNWRIRKPDGRLPAPPHDASGHTWHHPDDHLFRITKNGVQAPLAPIGYQSDMPGFGGVLMDEEIWAVLAYIKSAWPPRILKRQERLNKAMEQ